MERTLERSGGVAVMTSDPRVHCDWPWKAKVHSFFKQGEHWHINYVTVVSRYLVVIQHDCKMINILVIIHADDIIKSKLHCKKL
ncbi:unnamed protein product [Staurois parvus]|uniref:Uncharacterized protein n=1 Tax=Staurois parvus TaxID=386267 RepID=A0ABN9AVJ3_9NEOB|nr:unnamed protein product [Staurois parvus]